MADERAGKDLLQHRGGHALALPSAEFRQYINASQRYLGPVILSIRVSWSFPTAPTRRRSCRIPPRTVAVSRRSPTVIKTGVNTRLGWLSDQDSNLNRLNSNLEERAVIAVRRHVAGVGLAGIRCATPRPPDCRTRAAWPCGTDGE